MVSATCAADCARLTGRSVRPVGRAGTVAAAGSGSRRRLAVSSKGSATAGSALPSPGARTLGAEIFGTIDTTGAAAAARSWPSPRSVGRGRVAPQRWHEAAASGLPAPHLAQDAMGSAPIGSTGCAVSGGSGFGAGAAAAPTVCAGTVAGSRRCSERSSTAPQPRQKR